MRRLAETYVGHLSRRSPHTRRPWTVLSDLRHVASRQSQVVANRRLQFLRPEAVAIGAARSNAVLEAHNCITPPLRDAGDALSIKSPRRSTRNGLGIFLCAFDGR